MVNVIVASEVVRWPVLDIVRLVLDDALSRIELLPAELKFKSVLVDPEEVRHAIAARQAKGRLHDLPHGNVVQRAVNRKVIPWMRSSAISPWRPTSAAASSRASVASAHQRLVQLAVSSRSRLEAALGDWQSRRC